MVEKQSSQAACTVPLVQSRLCNTACPVVTYPRQDPTPPGSSGMHPECPLTITPLARIASPAGANVRGRAGHCAVGHPERYRRGRDLRRQGNGRVGQAHDRVHHAPLLRPRVAGRLVPIQVRLYSPKRDPPLLER